MHNFDHSLLPWHVAHQLLWKWVKNPKCMLFFHQQCKKIKKKVNRENVIQYSLFTSVIWKCEASSANTLGTKEEI